MIDLSSAEDIPITRLAPELAAFAGRPCPRDYRGLWKGCVDGDFPAHQQRGRWFVNRSDLPKIAKGLGMMAPMPRRQRKVRAEAVAAI